MTANFTIEANITGQFTLAPACAQMTADPFGGVAFADYESALAAAQAHKETCEDCSLYGCYTTPVMDVDDVLDVNISNTHAAAVMARLGYGTECDLYGGASAEDFLGRVLIALAANNELADAGAPSTQSGRVIECGVPAGYYENVLTRLHALALEAQRLGRDVVWS